MGGLTGALFPFLFVTIACGACSGFHGLVCSGTTSKQIDKESDMHAIGYGAMLAEGVGRRASPFNCYGYARRMICAD